MSIDSLSTQQDIVGQYLDNLGYDHAGSASSCRLFIQACRALLVMQPSAWSQSSTNITFDPRLWQQQLEQAESWLNASASAGSSVSYYGFGGDFR